MILNPFCVSSDDFFSSGLIARAPRELHDDTMNGGQHSLPACLSRPVSVYQSSFLATQLSRYLVAFNLKTKGEDGKNFSDQELINQIQNWHKQDEKAETKEADKKEEKKEEEKEESKQEQPPADDGPKEEDTIEEAKVPEEPEEKKKDEKAEDNFPPFEVEILAVKDDDPLVKTDDKADEKKDEASKVRTRMVLLKFESDQAAFKYLIAAKESQVVQKNLYLIFLSGVSMSKILRTH